MHLSVILIYQQVNPGEYFDDCVVDAKRCDRGGDCQYLCDAVIAYAQICLEVGVCVDWRSETNCRKYCVCLFVCLSVCPAGWLADWLTV